MDVHPSLLVDGGSTVTGCRTLVDCGPGEGCCAAKTGSFAFMGSPDAKLGRQSSNSSRASRGAEVPDMLKFNILLSSNFTCLNTS